MAIELIKAIAFAPVNRIIKYIPHGNRIDAEAYWESLPMLVASGQMNYASRQENPGNSYTINLSARFKDPLGPLPFGIYKVELCSGRILIIGSPDIPVRFNETTGLSITTLNINHTSIDPPLELIP